MPLFSRRNEYLGVNAHLHSYYQAHSGWEGFHGRYISYLAEAIDAVLPPGYAVDSEQSLQLREFHPDTGEFFRRRSKPDLALYDFAPDIPRITPGGASAGATLIRPVVETMQPVSDEYLTAVVIYETDDDAVLGRPVTRIELLSPTNKQGAGRDIYLAKREITLKSGLCLVEIDLMHESDPIPAGMASYARHDANAYPYHITISNPRPSLYEGLATTHAFSVDTSLPTLDVPLAHGDAFALDFDGVYRVTYETLSAYSLRVDYAQPPAHFEAYSADDQARIRARMAAVAAAQR
jgi:hypothetical protein